MDNVIIEKLKKNIGESNKNKSSYWKKHLPNDSNFINEYEFLGFGSYTKKTFKTYPYKLLTKILFGSRIFKTNTYKKYKLLYDSIDRYIDLDTIRHIFTFEKLKALLNPKKICIIGDGKINGVLGAHLTFPEAKLFSVNLSETLINDYIIIQKLNTDLKYSVELIDNISSSITDKKLNLVPSNFKNFLINKNIDLFINIASFQEMNVNEVKNYFEIISQNKAKLYCCNREYKKLYDGEELFFKHYPWSKSKKIFWEDCPWHKKYYSLRYPFFHKYDGNMKHCLVDFS